MLVHVSSSATFLGLMQQDPLQIRDKLLAGLDTEYNVINMGIVVEVIGELENFHITKEALEATRLGKHINELRRKSQDRLLASRAKSLVKKWRSLLQAPPPPDTGPPPGGGGNNNSLSNNNNNSLTATNGNSRGGGGHHQPMTSPAPGHVRQRSTVLSPGLQQQPRPRVTPPPHHHAADHLGPLSSASTSPGHSRPQSPSGAAATPGSPDKAGAAKRRREEQQEAAGGLPEKRARVTEPTTAGLANGGVGGGHCDNDGAAVRRSSGRPPRGEKPEESSEVVRRSQRRGGDKSASSAGGVGLGSSSSHEDVLKTKMSKAMRAGRVRTTQELVQNLGIETRPGGVLRPPNHDGITVPDENKLELINRFFSSQQQEQDGAEEGEYGGHGECLSVPSGRTTATTTTTVSTYSPTPAVSPAPNQVTVEDILAQLPPVDAAQVLSEWEEEAVDTEEIEGLIPIMRPKVEVTEELVSDLNSGQLEHVGGVLDHQGRFREWHEMVASQTVGGDLLHILPYSVID